VAREEGEEEEDKAFDFERPPAPMLFHGVVVVVVADIILFFCISG
jgi:hypothetical protein